MKKETFMWMTLGLGLGMIITAAFTYNSVVVDKTKRSDPRLRKAEELLNEAEMLLRAAKKGRSSVPVLD